MNQINYFLIKKEELIIKMDFYRIHNYWNKIWKECLQKKLNILKKVLKIEIN
jgi:hypothetical protein